MLAIPHASVAIARFETICCLEHTDAPSGLKSTIRTGGGGEPGCSTPLQKSKNKPDDSCRKNAAVSSNATENMSQLGLLRNIGHPTLSLSGAPSPQHRAMALHRHLTCRSGIRSQGSVGPAKI
jgi:hypothetical protein